MSITCEYCGRDQDPGSPRCVACGAPLPVPRSKPLRVEVIDSPTQPIPAAGTPEVADTLQDGLKAVGAVAGSLGIGTIVLRVAAQGIAIAVSSFILGLTAGSEASGLNRYFPHLLTALLGGVLLGIVVTLVKKRSVMTLLAAPAGTILGSVVARLVPDINPALPLNALLTLAGGLLLATLGGYRSRAVRIPCLKVLQPIAGAIGGLLFALLGFIVLYRA
jgi:hypothetical protein